MSTNHSVHGDAQLQKIGCEKTLNQFILFYLILTISKEC